MEYVFEIDNKLRKCILDRVYREMIFKLRRGVKDGVSYVKIGLRGWKWF